MTDRFDVGCDHIALANEQSLVWNAYAGALNECHLSQQELSLIHI
jgi:hypothetical protein